MVHSLDGHPSLTFGDDLVASKNPRQKKQRKKQGKKATVVEVFGASTE
jgi:hypothetical protein